MTTSPQTGRVVDEVRTLLAAQGDPQTLRALIPASIRLLAAGEPVSPAQIADAAGVSVDQAEAALRAIGGETRRRDQDGHLVLPATDAAAPV